MKKSSCLVFLLISSFFFSCKKTENNSKLSNSEIKITNYTLYTLLDKGIDFDTLEFDNWQPFLFFKSGNLLSNKEKNAILISCPNHKTYKIEIYTQVGKKWIKNDELNLIDANPTQFYLDFKDYDFDGQKDIYLQRSASNGWSLSRGCLIIVNPQTKKLKEHKEVNNLANMNPDFENKIVYTDEIDYDNNGRKVNRRINKWKKDVLISYEIDKSKEIKF